MITTVYLPFAQPFSSDIRVPEVVQKGHAVSVISDNDIVVYDQTSRQASTDAFLILPNDAIGNEYFVLAYNTMNEVFGSDSSNETRHQIPDQFIIAASRDSTEVTITPSYPTIAGKPFATPF